MGSSIELVDYKVRILDPEKATGAATRVMIEFRNKITDQLWTTVSADRNLISASLNALIDGMEYGLLDYVHDIECIMMPRLLCFYYNNVLSLFWDIYCVTMCTLLSHVKICVINYI